MGDLLKIINIATQPMVPICLQEPKCVYAEECENIKAVLCKKYDIIICRKYYCNQKETDFLNMGETKEEQK